MTLADKNKLADRDMKLTVTYKEVTLADKDTLHLNLLTLADRELTFLTLAGRDSPN